MDYHEFLVRHLALVDKVVRFVARRHHLSQSDLEEFASLVRFKLVDRDFAVLRKFEQRSSISTYLTVVIDRLCLDFHIAKWGKWRPSAVARRLGPVAILLERLIVRDGITFDEAVGTLQTNHGVSETREELHTMLLRLPVRVPRRSTTEHLSAAGETSDSAFDSRDDEHVVARVHAALAEALERLSDEERHIVSLRFGQGLTVPQMALTLDVDPKPLYRRLEAIIRTLGRELRGRGIDEQEIRRIVGHPTLALSGVISHRRPSDAS